MKIVNYLNSLEQKQIFILFCVPHFFVSVLQRFSFENPELSPIISIFLLFVIIFDLTYLFLIGSFLYKVNNNKFKYFIKYFEISFLIIGISIILNFIYIFTRKYFEIPFGLIFVLTLITLSSIIYVIYFISSLLSSIINNRKAKFEDFIGWFFLFAFLPLGIWFIQPKLKKIESEKKLTTQHKKNKSNIEKY